MFFNFSFNFLLEFSCNPYPDVKPVYPPTTAGGFTTPRGLCITGRGAVCCCNPNVACAFAIFSASISSFVRFL